MSLFKRAVIPPQGHHPRGLIYKRPCLLVLSHWVLVIQHRDLVRACSVHDKYLFSWRWPLHLFAHLVHFELGVTDSQCHVSLRLNIYSRDKSSFKFRIISLNEETKWQRDLPPHCLMPFQSPAVLSIRLIRNDSFLISKNPKHIELSLQHTKAKAKRKKKLFCMCVNSYSFFLLAMLLLIAARGDNSPRNIQHSKPSTAGWLSCCVSE